MNLSENCFVVFRWTVLRGGFTASEPGLDSLSVFVKNVDKKRYFIKHFFKLLNKNYYIFRTKIAPF